MKKLSWLNRIIYFVNSIIAFLLLCSYLLPYISPQTFPLLSLLSLLVPVLILANLAFVLYWLIKLRKQFLISLIVLLIGFTTVTSFFRISEKQVLLNDDLKIMSYNVRLFNLYNWKPESTDSIRKSIVEFVHEKSPDIVCFQEFVNDYSGYFKYKYRFVNNKNGDNKRIRFGQAIYSKYKIINSGSINFKSNTNNAIYADIVKEKDTFRVYNVHLESLKIQLDQENLGEEDSEKLRKRLQTKFGKQVDQVSLLLENEKNCPFKTIICGDFNNTAFSWVYNQLKGDKNDAFVEAGDGFGKSYDYFLPARIDFILPNEAFTVNNFKNYFIDYSDHYPIMTRLQLK
ncbi:MAG: endonuclease [Bacteroidetes bacterium MedPE-SWsnd-G1]|nr:MAG: endonuclease [Bacteroidetes bacterium MedPE-SWsnd-G1]